MTKLKLTEAQEITIQIFEAVEKSNLIIAGKSEAQLSLEVCALATEKFNIESHWHKKIVRAGKNTMCIYPDNPPNETIQADDIVILDFGPIVDGYEADLGRTYIIGNDAKKLKIKYDVEKAWYETQAWYKEQTSLKSSDLFKYVVDKANENGYTFGGEIAGHIVGKFPHEQPLDPASLELDIHPKNNNDLFLLDTNGDERHWILELLFIDEENEIGGYFEQLL
jgi:Xaa-Pro aminopeptidase